jgi:hypothetical protein
MLKGDNVGRRLEPVVRNLVVDYGWRCRHSLLASDTSADEQRMGHSVSRKASVNGAGVEIVD